MFVAFAQEGGSKKFDPNARDFFQIWLARLFIIIDSNFSGLCPHAVSKFCRYSCAFPFPQWHRF
jgi:hypothetical protein